MDLNTLAYKHYPRRTCLAASLQLNWLGISGERFDRVSKQTTLGWSCLREPLLGRCSLHVWPGSYPVQEGHEPWPSAHVDLVNFRPIQDRIGISVSDSERLPCEIELIPKLAIQDVKSLR